MARKNKEDDKTYQRNYYLANKEKRNLRDSNWKKANKHRVARTNRIWYENNPDKVAAKEIKRRFSKQNRTPKWLTKQQLMEISEFYILAKELQWLNNGPLEVDHIVPLQGKNVSGLHVPWNLQILPRELNRSKGNK